ncbi:MAG: hypothetical protein CMP10_21420 [Zetaproteobacteria bacterium]|nr:hypothetical protein [Pseudobdellovibrionaceae bacterium]
MGQNSFDVYDFDDYRVLIRATTKWQDISFKVICSSTQLHSSWFSRVMSGNADFSEEQLYKIGKVFKFRDEELEFFLLLGAQGRSGCKRHQSFLRKKVKAIQDHHRKVAKKLEKVCGNIPDANIAMYYQDAITAKIHILLTVDRYAQNPKLISRKLGISERKVEAQLSLLVKLGLITYDGVISVLKTSIHLDESHACSTTNHKNWRLETINYLTRNEPLPSDYHLSAVFSCDEDTKVLIKEKLRQTVVEIQKIVGSATQVEESYYIGLDVF